MAQGMVWLASYPKCGNTWLRSFLAAYGDVDAQVDLNAMESTIAASRIRLDDALGIETADLLPNEIRELLPIGLREWARTPGTPRFVKVHDACGLTRDGACIFPQDATHGVIHLVRDPRDIVVSLRHHRGSTVEAEIKRLNDPQEWVAKGHRGVGAQVPQFLGDWTTHTRSWLEAPLRRLTLRYEDMLADPIGCFRQIVQFCHMPLDEAHLAQAVAATSFASLKAKEAAQGFRERPSDATAPFFREGRAGGWKDVLTPAQADAIVTAHGDMMRQFGYAF